MADLSITNTFSAGTTIVAADMNTNFSEIETWVNTTPGVLQLTGGTVTGAASFGDTVVVTGDLTVDTSTLKVDTANNVVGIGTASPSASYVLDVSGAANVTGTVTATAFAGPITGAVTGNVTGDVTGSSGSCTGNAATATTATTAGTVTTAAQSAITSVGTLTGLTVSAGSDNATVYLGDNADTYINGDGGNSAIGITIDGVSVGAFWETAGLSITNSLVATGVGTDLVIHADGWIQKKSSSIRYKNVATVNMEDHLNASMVDSLAPKMWSYKSDADNHPMVSFIAEDCDAVSPFLAVHDPDGQVETTDKDALIALLTIGLQDARERLAILEA